jgi:hypothetical protein
MWSKQINMVRTTSATPIRKLDVTGPTTKLPTELSKGAVLGVGRVKAVKSPEKASVRRFLRRPDVPSQGG